MRFKSYLVARFVAVLAAQIQTVVTGWQVYEATGSTFNLGLVGLTFFLPYMIFMPFAGDAADRFNRGKIAGFSGLLFGILIGLQSYWLSKYPSEISGTLFVLFGLGAAKAYSSAANGAMISLLVPKSDLMRAITLNTAMFNISSVGGPALGGFLYAQFGAVKSLQVAAGLSVLGAIMFFCIPVASLSIDSMESRFQRIAAGFRYIWREKDILGSISLDLFAVFFGGAMALLPVFCKDILHVGPDGFGILRSATALGSIPMALYLAKRPIRVEPGKKLFRAVTIFGFAMIGFGLSRTFWLSFAFLVISGAADVVSVYVRHGLLQLKVSEAMRGRVTAANQVFIGASNELGEFESGMAATLFGPVGAVVGGGVITLICVYYWQKVFPGLANLQKLEHNP
jgi:MFS family permease